MDHAERVGWAVALWAVTVAEPLHLIEVDYDGQVWSRDTGTWAPAATDAPTPPPAGQVLVHLAG